MDISDRVAATNLMISSIDTGLMVGSVSVTVTNLKIIIIGDDGSEESGMYTHLVFP